MENRWLQYAGEVSRIMGTLDGWRTNPNDKRRARKERARMLTAQRMAEIQAQGGNPTRTKKRK